MRTISFSSLVKLKILKEVLFKDLSLALCIVFKYIYFQIISPNTAWDLRCFFGLEVVVEASCHSQEYDHG